MLVGVVGALGYAHAVFSSKVTRIAKSVTRVEDIIQHRDFTKAIVDALKEAHLNPP